MKKQLLYTVLALLAANLAFAQVLYTEDFESYNTGPFSTDLTGATQAQGGWYTASKALVNPSLENSSYFKIVTEPGRGKVMELSAIPDFGQNYLQKRGIDALWNNRAPGNDILKIEYDFFTGEKVTSLGGYNHIFPLKIDYSYDYVLNAIASSWFYSTIMQIIAVPTSSYYFISDSQNILLQENTWVKLIFYLDYQNQKTYFSIPSTGVLMANDSLVATPISTISIAHLSVNIQSQYPLFKYDNFIVSAVDHVPLSVNNFVSSKFNIFPNPANDVVTVSNNENIGIEKLTVYDVNGKMVKKKNGEKENQIQLNISNLMSGTYLLHIKTNEGTAVKKLVKK